MQTPLEVLEILRIRIPINQLVGFFHFIRGIDVRDRKFPEVVCST